jgi:phosphoribosylglycinamide formyltransferase-1
MLKLGFLASRNGSSARAIVEAAQAGRLAVEPRLLVSNNRSCAAMAFAAERGLATLHIPTQNDPEAADLRLRDAMVEAGVELIVLSGYLRRLGPKTLTRYAGRILNIHPGPLPAFGGEGMYGRRVHEAVIAAGVAESGVAVHVVDEEYDHGPVLARATAPVPPGDTVEALEARITALEPAFFVETIARVVSGDLKLPKGPGEPEQV